MSGDNLGWFLFAFDMLAIIAVFSGLAWFIRLRNQAVVNPSKKYPQGQMVMEIWTVAGPRVKFLRPIAPGGYEVVPPEGAEHSLRYFYTRSAVGKTMYPTWMPFDFLRVEAPIASWWENHSVAIDPAIEQVEFHGQCPACQAELDLSQEVIISDQTIPADLQKRLQDTDSLASGDELLRDAQETGEAFAKMLTSMRYAQYLPIIAIAACIASIIAAVFAYRAFELLGG